MLELNEAFVVRLVTTQFPEFAGMRVRKVEPGGNDNRTFRLGDELSVRLPSAKGYVSSVEKEQRWLPLLAPQLPQPIPAPVRSGVPGDGYPWPWSINRWIEGQTLSRDTVPDALTLARDLAEFLVALRTVDAGDGPLAGAHSFYRGASLRNYDAETREAIDTLGARSAALGIWETALVSEWVDAPVWFHGDVASGNLLVRDGELAAVIDFGTSGVGDPACDLVIAWTFLEGDERRIFRDAVGLDAATWARARGWALWKALITIAEPGNPQATDARRVLADVLADPVA